MTTFVSHQPGLGGEKPFSACQHLVFPKPHGQFQTMFTIEHEFDATVVTLIDEPGGHRQEDVTITAFEECVTLEQTGSDGETIQKITLSPEQLADLTAALNLPEGVYSRSKDS